MFLRFLQRFNFEDSCYLPFVEDTRKIDNRILAYTLFKNISIIKNCMIGEKYFSINYELIYYDY